MNEMNWKKHIYSIYSIFESWIICSFPTKYVPYSWSGLYFPFLPESFYFVRFWERWDFQWRVLLPLHVLLFESELYSALNLRLIWFHVLSPSFMIIPLTSNTHMWAKLRASVSLHLYYFSVCHFLLYYYQNVTWVVFLFHPNTVSTLYLILLLYLASDFDLLFLIFQIKVKSIYANCFI